MTYGEAYLEGWKNIFNYEGVSNRFEFWSFMIGSGVICLLPLLCWWLAVTINNDYGVFIFFCAARVIYFNVDFCHTGDSVSRQKDARYRIFRVGGYHCRVDPCYGRNSAYTVLPAVKVTRPGIMTEGMTHHFLRHAFH